MEQQLLMCPGPTVVPDRVLKAISKPVIHHRTPEFTELFDQCTQKLKKVYKTQGQVFTFAGSGTAAMQASIVNTIEHGDKVLCIVAGKFAERYSKIASTFGGNVENLEFEWNSAADIEKVKEKLTEDTKLVTVIFNETSTSVRNPIKEIAALTKDTDTLLAVDAISGLGGDVLEMDDWGIDLCITGSQKCLAMTTGLAFLAVSDKAWKTVEQNKSPRYYFDLPKYKKKYPQTPYSTPTSLVFGLEEALNMIEEEGLENRIKRHAENAKLCRDGIKAMGLELFPKSEDICSNTLTAVKYEKSNELFDKLDEKYHIRIAKGQAHLKGKIFRIGHMGVVGKEEVEKTIAAIGELVKEL